jgi:hypothetical protein
MLLSLAMTVSIISIMPTISNAAEESDYPEELETLTKQYLMYATGENALQLNSTKTTINGNLYRKADLYFTGG